MAFFEALRMAIEAIRGHKLRSGLTLLGMVIGVFAIIVSVTAVKVIDVYFQDSMKFLGTSTFTISRYPAIQTGPMDASLRNRPPITYEQVERFERAMNLPVTISPLEDFTLGRVKYAGRETTPNIVLLGGDENFPDNFGYELDQGRMITEQDVQYGRSLTVLGADIVEELFPNETPIGKTVRMDGHRFEVIGTLQKKGSFLGFSLDNRLIVPITRLISIYGQPDRNIASISVRVADANRLASTMEEAIGRMRMVRKVEPGKPNNFELDTNDSMQAIFDAFTGTLTAGGALIGLIALLAAGIGIMNIMLVSVTERTREIGVRKSVGARRRDIMRQFLFEAFFLCQIGGLIGIILGMLLGNIVALQFDIRFAFPWGWAIAAVVMVTFLALVFGGYPAYKAAKLDPIESLRYE
ncbi:MAG: FtsX-like permease family protein [Rhodothermales bacterium]|nr:FtsX-like permease family protein [Rhodothermales bacterium]